jgi:hypothetical protein
MEIINETSNIMKSYLQETKDFVSSTYSNSGVVGVLHAEAL